MEHSYKLQKNLIILLLLNVLASVAMRIFGLFLPLVGQSLEASEVIVGASLSLGSLLRTITLIPAGIIADRTSHDRLLLTLAILGQGIAIVLLGIIIYPIQLFLISPIQGVTQGIIGGFLLARIADLAKGGRIGRSVSYYTATFSLGLAIGSSVGGPIIEIYGLQIAYFTFGLILCCASSTLLGYSPNIISRSQPPKDDNIDYPIKNDKKKYPQSYFHLLGSYLTHNLGFGGFYAFFVLFVLYLGGTPLVTGFADGISQFTGLICIPFMGELADRKDPKTVIMIAFWGDVFLVTMFSLITDALWILPLMILSGINGAASTTGLLSMAASIVKDQQGTALATANTIMNLGFTISPLIGGYLLSLNSFVLLLPYSIFMLSLAAIWSTLYVKKE